MKRLVAGMTLALFGLAPMAAMACEYTDASMASSTPEAKLGLVAAPQATKAPATVVAKEAATKQVKATTSDKARTPANDTKIAEATRR
ncbi:MAG TPA: hypothetical protein VFS06_10055 [Casimicrobiaceae bacterium]|nr:hypothetical protein [Casimicrobiaceae bacterium]HET9749630.1 hypothetical protein [Casimicrobiaceae bacterium]HWD16435.1 hypothetical protein [Casimicrobiaceae bacterium]HWD35614.1 hypothetical protein [Casimicrobiaceae bacterium]